MDFAVADSTKLDGYTDAFNTVIDSGMFHCLDDDGRRRYAAAVHRATRPGATLLLSCFSDANPVGEEWPRPAVSEKTLRDVLGGAGWDIASLSPPPCAAARTARKSKWHLSASARNGATLTNVAAGRSGVRLAELAAALDAPRSSVHGLVKGLVATGYLTEKAGAYSIGPAIGALVMTAPPTIDPVARPAMEALHRRFDETVMLGSRVGDSVVYTDSVESTRSSGTPHRYTHAARTTPRARAAAS